MSHSPGQEAVMEEEMEGPSVAKLLRSAFESRRSCCCRNFEAVWFERWGTPLHTVSPGDLLCCRSMQSPPSPLNECWRPQRADADLRLFSPQQQEVWIYPSRPMLEAAKSRKRACFDAYAETRSHAPLRRPQHGIIEGAVPLPHDLLVFSVVLPHLPLPAVFRARTVCWFWHETLSSPLYLRQVMENRDFYRSRLVMQTSTAIHSSCLAIFEQDHWLPNPIPLPPFCLRAAVAGLLCFSFENAGECWEDGSLLVGSPLTQQWRQLPPVPQHMNIIGESFSSSSKRFSRDVACTMWADPVQGCYKVFVLHDTALYIYDSLSGQWEGQSKRPLANYRLANFCRRDCSITPSGLLHQLSVDGQVVFSYDMGDKSKSYVKTYGPSNMDLLQLKQPYSRLPALAYCNSRVFVVARMKSEKTMDVGSWLPWVIHGPVAIWELHILASGDTGRWGWPVSVAPQDLLEDAIAGSDGTDFCVTTDDEKIIYLVLPGGSIMLAYDVVSTLWTSLSGCPPAYLIGFHPQPYYMPLLWLGSV